MNWQIAILVCVIAGSATIQAINRKKMSEVMDMSEEEIDDVTNKCKEESDLSDDTGIWKDIANLENMLDGDTFSPQKLGEFFRNLGCFISCVFEKSNVTLNDAIQVDNALRMIERYEHVMKDQKTEKFRDCLYKVKDETDKCDVALLFTVCVLEHIEGLDDE